MASVILGISAFYHDSAAVLLVDGEIIAAAQEERFTRIKHDASFPTNAVKYVLEAGGYNADELTAVAFYDKPLLKFERLLETYHAFAPKGLANFLSGIPVWIKEKLFTRKILRKEIGLSNKKKVPLLFPEHHLSHAASAYYPSPFKESAILTIDGVGEWSTASICYGKDNTIKVLRELHFPHSIGLLYSAFTYYLGFTVNSGEYKVMGLAPYGDAGAAQTLVFKEKILGSLADIRDDGSMILNMEYFNYATGLTMTKNKKWEQLFGLPLRKPESEISSSHMNLALAIQQVLEKIVLALARTAQQLTGSRNLVMAGGVALNCVSNSKLAASGIYDNTWIQPAAGDAGGAIGAAFAAFNIWGGNKKERSTVTDSMMGCYLGPEYNDQDIKKSARKYDAPYTHFENFNELSSVVSRKIAGGKVIGWFQGRMEFGPRALGNRSILADPRNPAMQKLLNEKIKFREGFRPFAPAVLAEDVSSCFGFSFLSPYMLFVADVKDALRIAEPPGYLHMELYERLYHQRSVVPAITHVDYSARIQTVSADTNRKFWQLINDFKNLTNCPMVINTSFNRRGEPIVCTPEDAYECFMQTGLDFLVIGNFLFDKQEQRTPIFTKEFTMED